MVAAEPATALNRLLAGDVDLAVVDEYDYVPIALPDFVVCEELLCEPLVLVSRPGTLAAARPRLGDLYDAR